MPRRWGIRSILGMDWLESGVREGEGWGGESGDGGDGAAPPIALGVTSNKVGDNIISSVARARCSFGGVVASLVAKE